KTREAKKRTSGARWRIPPSSVHLGEKAAAGEGPYAGSWLAPPVSRARGTPASCRAVASLEGRGAREYPGQRRIEARVGPALLTRALRRMGASALLQQVEQHHPLAVGSPHPPVQLRHGGVADLGQGGVEVGLG